MGTPVLNTIIRTLIITFLMEIGSASNITIAAMATNTSKPYVILIAGVLGIFIADFIAMKVGAYLKYLPIPINLLSGMIMILTGAFFLWKGA